MAVVLLAITTLLAAEPIKLAAPQLQGAAVDTAKVQFYSDFLAQQLAAAGMRVTTRAEIIAVLGIERQRQLLACEDSSGQCLAELAGALGVDAIVTGSVAKTEGGNFALTVKIVSARDTTPLALATGRFKSEDALLDFITDQAPRLAA